MYQPAQCMGFHAITYCWLVKEKLKLTTRVYDCMLQQSGLYCVNHLLNLYLLDRRITKFNICLFFCSI